jgi:hypothetical protein
MPLGIRPRVCSHAAVVVRDTVVNLALNEHLLAIMAVNTVCTSVLVVAGDCRGVRGLVKAESGRTPDRLACAGLRGAVARVAAGLAARGGGVNRREPDIEVRAVAVIGALLRCLVDGDEGLQARECRRHGAVADLQLGADEDEAQGDVVFGE